MNPICCAQPRGAFYDRDRSAIFQVEQRDAGLDLATVNYPAPYIWTTTKDDRVGPQHARKFAARLKDYGLPYHFYEDLAGGHSGDADIEQGARLQAMQLVYFGQRLEGAEQ